MEKLLSCTLGVVISVRFLRFAFDDFESLDLSDNPLFIFLSVVDLRDRVPADMLDLEQDFSALFGMEFTRHHSCCLL